MAKSIRLSMATQQRVADEVALHAAETSVVVSDAKMVDALVKEACAERDRVRARRMEAQRKKVSR